MTGRDETPDEALRSKAAQAIWERRLPTKPWESGSEPSKNIYRESADAVLAAVAEQLRQQGRDEERARRCGCRACVRITP